MNRSGRIIGIDLVRSVAICGAMLSHVVVMTDLTLPAPAADHLFRILRGLRDEGKTIILITHKLREIMAVTDRVSVMRAGEMVAHRVTAQTSAEELGELMIGRRLRRDAGDRHP